MKEYGITTYAREDKPQMTCYYPYEQWLELKKEFEECGIPFHAFEIEREVA